MTDSPLEPINLLDTEYADILANSSAPNFELTLIQLGLDPQEARIKTKFITLLKKKPETQDDWQELINTWEEACGYQPNKEQLQLTATKLWGTECEDILNYNWAMYTDDGNRAVGEMMLKLKEALTSTSLPNIVEMLQTEIKIIEHNYPEVDDTCVRELLSSWLSGWAKEICQLEVNPTYWGLL